MKTLSSIANLHDLKSIPRTRKSAKPQLPTTAILDLYMARNERDRLVKERMKLAKRKIQIDRRMEEIDEEMDELLRMATKKAAEIRGSGGTVREFKLKEARPDHKRVVLEY